MSVEDMRLVPGRIEWSQGVTERFEFQTQILTSYDGSEQRVAGRTKPRLRYEYTAFMGPLDWEQASPVLDKDLSGERWMPHPRLRGALAAEASGASPTLTLAESWPGRVAEDEAVILERRDGRQEIVFLAGTQAGNVYDLKAAPRYTYPAGSRAYMGVKGYLQNADVQMRTSRAGLAKFQFIARPQEAFHVSYGSQFATFGSRNLFEPEVNWRGGVNVQLSQPAEDYDTGRSGIVRRLPVAESPRVYRLPILLRTAAQADHLIGSFYEARGRQKRFYMPSPVEDLYPAGTIPAGATSIPFTGDRVYRLALGSTTHDRLYLRWPGETQAVRLNPPTLDAGGDSWLHLQSPTAQELRPGFGRVSWLPSCRFAADELEIQWATDGVGRSDVNITTLPRFEEGA